MTKLSKKSILKKTAQVGISSLISKFLGIVREVLQARYLDAPGPISDAFAIAYKIPNSLRKVFAEGALSAAFIPTVVKIVKEDKQEEASKLLTLMIMTIGVIVLSICLLIFLFPQPIILFFAPGFVKKTLEFSIAVPITRTLIFFIFFISLGSLFTGAIQATQHFLIPAWGPVLLNVVYILGLLLSLHYNLSLTTFTMFILIGALIQLILYIYKYLALGFYFAWPNKIVKEYFKQIMSKFLPCLFSMSAMEINLLIDTQFSSNLSSGSITLIYLSSRFMGIALSAFAVSFSSILLSHFSRVSIYAPKRLSYYLLESTKFIFWITIPVTILMAFFSYDIFYTAFYQFTDKFTLADVAEASNLLIAFVSGLFFYSINKLLLSVYYSFHQTFLPTLISLAGTVINVLLNVVLIPKFQALGLAIATTISAVIQTILFLWILQKKFNFVLFIRNFTDFLGRYLIQLLFIIGFFFSFYYFGVFIISNIFSTNFANFLLHKVGLWLWVGPLSLFTFILLYLTRNLFKIKLYFLG